jgi:hypothetical protein
MPEPNVPMYTAPALSIDFDTNNDELFARLRRR